MKYFMLEGTFKNPIPVEKAEFEKLIKEHLSFLQKGFEQGWILVSGPKANRNGGIIIVKGTSLEEIEKYFSADPFADVQEYHIVEFELHDCQEMVRNWFN